ncbi:hypothetical protein CY34DRAFT_802123 [Suillus luteus UH-Slu-Lm8-n1]|uniref:Uncharacterized protein n=1 Tax=Suillus luteus UH-Slu-Lm8-n1 TaxID=930992 RepID=A0A0D0ATL7_9AGAM|nr:hypothetical protein CY34DRAFT_802123 [Suillus luteus UH-Slu-Lm8-n1]
MITNQLARDAKVDACFMHQVARSHRLGTEDVQRRMPNFVDKVSSATSTVFIERSCTSRTGHSASTRSGMTIIDTT